MQVFQKHNYIFLRTSDVFCVVWPVNWCDFSMINKTKKKKAEMGSRSHFFSNKQPVAYSALCRCLYQYLVLTATKKKKKKILFVFASIHSCFYVFLAWINAEHQVKWVAEIKVLMTNLIFISFVSDHGMSSKMPLWVH